MPDKEHIDIYSLLSHPDGRIEKWHFHLNDPEVYDDLVNKITPMVKVDCLPPDDFDDEQAFRVALHRDLHKAGDAQGERIGFIEYYEI